MDMKHAVFEGRCIWKILVSQMFLCDWEGLKHTWNAVYDPAVHPLGNGIGEFPLCLRMETLGNTSFY